MVKGVYRLANSTNHGESIGFKLHEPQTHLLMEHVVFIVRIVLSTYTFA